MVIRYTHTPLLDDPDNVFFRCHPKFSLLPDICMRYLVLMADPMSPARFIDVAERSKVVQDCLGGVPTLKEGGVPDIIDKKLWVECWDAYRALCPDDTFVQDSISAIENYIRQINNLRSAEYGQKPNNVQLNTIKMLMAMSEKGTVAKLIAELEELRGKLISPSPEPPRELVQMEKIFLEEEEAIAEAARKAKAKEDKARAKEEAAPPSKKIHRIDDVTF